MMVSEIVDQGPVPDGQSVTAYADLAEPAKEAVDEVLRDEWTTFSTYDDHAALEALPRTLYVEKGGEQYEIRTMSADGGGGLFEGIAHDTLLTIAGLLFGAAVYVRNPERQFKTLVAFPFISTAVILGVNLLRAPDPSLMHWFALTSLGIVLAVPVLVGIAARQRDIQVGGIAALILVIGIGVLFLGDGVSPLGVMIGLVLVSVPGGGLGWWVGNRGQSTSTTH